MYFSTIMKSLLALKFVFGVCIWILNYQHNTPASMCQPGEDIYHSYLIQMNVLLYLGKKTQIQCNSPVPPVVFRFYAFKIKISNYRCNTMGQLLLPHSNKVATLAPFIVCRAHVLPCVCVFCCFFPRFSCIFVSAMILGGKRRIADINLIATPDPYHLSIHPSIHPFSITTYPAL